MRRPTLALSTVAVLAAFATGAPPVVRAQDAPPEYPLASSKLVIVDGGGAARRRLVFEGAWAGVSGRMNPAFDGSTLRVFGGPKEGDSGLIRLAQSRWRPLPKGKGFVYVDEQQQAGGIRRIVLRTTRRGGRLKIEGGRENFLFALTPPPSTLTVTFTVGDARWCAAFEKPKAGKGKLKARARRAPTSCPCESFASTWQAIQTVVFERRGCTQAACHGSAPGQGNLDLRPEAAYDNLVGRFSVLGQQNLVERGSRQDSFLWRKLAAATEGLAGVPGTPMPSGLPPISEDELEAIRLWIQFGAPKDTVVEGTEALLNSCLPAPVPPRIAAPPPPPAGEGVQLHAPPWTIGPKGEDEVCYATWVDVEALVPDEYKVPCPPFWSGVSDTCFFFNRSELTQEPNSHHSIIHVYRGTHEPTWSEGDDRGFDFRCHGGAADGQPCDPRVAGACGEGSCQGAVKSAVACLNYGPPDYSRGFSPTGGVGSDNAPSVGGSQQPFVRNVYPPGVFGVYPTKAVWVWNSHAFNLYGVPTTNEQWYNVYFARAEDRVHPVQPVFDAEDIFVQDVPPFEEREYCRTITFGQGTRLFELSSHTHKRGRLFRVWGPGIAGSCRSTRTNPGACVPEQGRPPTLVTTEYNDPAQVRFDPPLALDDPDPAQRRFKFCAIYDNGLGDPTNVKRNSTSPIARPVSFFVGGPCRIANGPFARDRGIACLAGPKKGMACGGDDRVCDSAPGARDGVCDACPLEGGVTTEDEMFILLGAYFCQPGTSCESGYGL
jgi:hypothetical protein